jgi:3-deoxy-D-manno-octulosonic-acid transferase
MAIGIRGVWWLLSTIALPLFLFVGVISKKLRVGLSARLGFGEWSGLSAEPSIWLHAASVGEIQGVKPFLSALKTGRRVVLTTTSATGRAAGEKVEGVDFCELLPVDHPLILRRVIRRINPVVLIVFETELWPNLFYENSGIPICVVNGRISDKAFPRYRFLAPLLRPVVSGLAKILVQSERDAERFREIGALSPVVSGSTKYDTVVEEDRVAAESLRKDFGLLDGDSILVAGSVRPGEGEIILAAFRQLQSSFPSLRLVYAPRHPERFEADAQLIEEQGFRLSRRSAPAADGAEVFLLDSLGELRIAYQLGSVCFIGGTLVEIGGHNPLEAAALGKPLLLGPHTSNVEDVSQDLLRAGGAFRVDESNSIVTIVSELLNSPERREQVGRAARSVAQSHRGAVERVLSELRHFLAEDRG